MIDALIDDAISRRRSLTYRYCPVCWQRIEPTYAGNIAGHRDSLGTSTCLGSHEPMHITLVEIVAASA